MRKPIVVAELFVLYTFIFNSKLPILDQNYKNEFSVLIVRRFHVNSY